MTEYLNQDKQKKNPCKTSLQTTEYAAEKMSLRTAPPSLQIRDVDHTATNPFPHHEGVL